MSVTFQDRDRDFRARHAGDFTGEFTGLMRSMRELNPSTSRQKASERSRFATVMPVLVSGDNAKGVCPHVVKASFKSASSRFQPLLSSKQRIYSSQAGSECDFFGMPAAM